MPPHYKGTAELRLQRSRLNSTVVYLGVRFPNLEQEPEIKAVLLFCLFLFVSEGVVQGRNGVLR